VETVYKMLHEETTTNAPSQDTGCKKVRKSRNVHDIPGSEEASLLRSLKFLEGCTDCSYHIGAKQNYVDGFGGNPCKVLIVFDWAHQLEPYKMPGILRQAISAAKIPAHYVRYTSAIRCSNLTNQGDHAKNIRACRQHLLTEIGEVKPKVVITIGDAAYMSLSGNKDNGHFHTIVNDSRGFYRINLIPTLGGQLNNKLRAEVFSALKKVNNLIEDITYPPDARYITVETEEQLEKAEKILLNAPELVFDFEVGTDLDKDYNGFDPEDTLLCCGFSWGEGRAITIPLDHSENTLPREKCHALVQKILTSNVPKIAHNAIYDQYAAYHFYHGLEVKNVVFDTMLAHHLLDPTQGTHSLKYLTGIYTPYGGYEGALDKHFVGGDGRRNYGNVPLNLLAKYCSVDVDMTYRMKAMFSEKIKQDEKLRKLFKYLVMPISDVFYGIRKEGMYVNESKLEKIKEYYTTTLQESMRKLYANKLVVEHAPALNIGSAPQLRKLLYDTLNLRVVKTTDKMSPSTDEEAVNRLGTLYKGQDDIQELLECIITIRKCNKYISTYVDGFAKHIRGNHVYTTYLLHGTTSARPSSIKPNLLNIPSESPKETPYEYQIKSVFEAPPGYLFCSADFSQIELRNIGNETHEPELVDAYLANQDMHSKTASLIFGVDLSAVASYQRKIGKTTNFGGAYGAGAATLAAQIEKDGSLSDEELLTALNSVGIYKHTKGLLTADERNNLMVKLAKYIQQTLFQKWAMFGKWQQAQRTFAETHKKIYSRFGRCRYLHFPPNATNSQKWRLINTAVNYPIQSVSSDVLMLSMVRIAKEFKKRGMNSHIVGQVYDSINYYIWEEEKDEALSLIKTVMECEALTYDREYFTIPMEVDIQTGPNWAQLANVNNIKYIEGLYD
jgi:DNA polymerase-1